MGPVVQTKYGAVRGDASDGVSRFLGIPYAASPTGALRFGAPVPPEPWDGVRAALAFGPTPPKPTYPVPFDTLLPEPGIDGDDWLNLNVWTPDPQADGLPVMVWIHGGAFANGNSAVPMYDGQAFARDGVVLVSINYRLGVDGFALLPDAPANRGLLDQIAALEWVRDNISAFGGDPANVTIFGESAGGMSVTTLLSLRRAAGLFAKVIAQSGAGQAAAAPADAAMVTAELGKVLGVEPTASSLAALDLADLIAAQATIRDALAASPDPARFGASIVASSMPLIPVLDGDLMTAPPLTSIAAGNGAEIPLLIGTNAEEFRLFLVPSGVAALITDEALAVMAAGIGGNEQVIAKYRENRPGASPGDLLAALITDRFFWMPALAVAEARAAGPASTYFYEFAWRSPGLGAAHALEIPFVFDNLSAPGAEAAVGPGAPQEVADQMHAAWVRFASTGDPGWAAFDASRPVRVFDAGGGSVELDQRRDEREIWPQGEPQD
ncbi:MAG TPA: carboxylesterase family protein [Streptosporangiaceae bacterium]